MNTWLSRACSLLVLLTVGGNVHAAGGTEERLVRLEAQVNGGGASASTQLELARMYLDAGRYYEASKAAGRVLAIDQSSQGALEIKTKADEQLRLHTQASLKRAEELAAKRDATAADRLALADAYYEAGQYRSAAEVYKSLPADTRTRENRLREARALSWSGRLHQAEALYLALIREQADPALELEYGRTLSWMGASRAAVERLESHYRGNQTDESVVALANAKSWSGDREGALQLLRTHIDGHPDSPEARALLAEIETSPDLRLEQLDRLIELEPYNLALRLERARLLVGAERYGEALRTIEFVEEHSPGEIEGLAALRADATARRDEQLVRLRAQKPQLDATTPETSKEILDLARAYSSIQAYDESIALYDRYLAMNPDDTKARVEYARVLSWDERYAASERQYRILLAEDPTRADLRLEYAQVLSWDSDYVPAINALQDLTDLSDHPSRHLYTDVPVEAQFNLGRIYRWFGWNDAAAEAQSNALAADASYAPARAELDLVRGYRPATAWDARYTNLENSNDFVSRQVDLQMEKWNSPRTAFSLNVGRHEFEEGSSETYQANVFGAGARYRFTDRYEARARVGLNVYDDDLGTSPFWSLGARYMPNLQSRADLEYAHYDLVYDVANIRTLLADPIEIDDLRAHYDYTSGGRLAWLADASYGFISDDNERFAAHGLVAFRILKAPYVALKADYRYLQHDFRSARYWSPQNYNSLAGVLHVGQDIRNRVFWDAELKFGRSWEEDRSSDIRAIEARATVPVSEMFDIVGAYAYGKSGRLDSIFPEDDEITNYWQRRWYVGIRLKQLFRDDDRRGRNPYYFDDGGRSGSPVLPPLQGVN